MSKRPFKPLDIVYLKRPDGRIVETAVERVVTADTGRSKLVMLKLIGIPELVPVEYVGRYWKTARDHKEPYPAAEGLPTLGRRHARNP